MNSDDGVRVRIDAAVRAIEEAQKLNNRMQKKFAGSQSEWHEHESIDEKLYEALKALGN